MEREYVHKEELDKYIIHLTDEQYRLVIEFAQQDINKKWEDKIREKIEELERKLKNETLYISFWAIHSKIRVLKKLLEE